MILLYGAIGYWGMKTERKWGSALYWFAIGCGLHSSIDIFTHVKDAPALFFPLNWSYRFAAPISYWDPEYGGKIFAPIEHFADMVMIIFLLLRRRKQQLETAVKPENQE